MSSTKKYRMQKTEKGYPQTLNKAPEPAEAHSFLAAQIEYNPHEDVNLMEKVVERDNMTAALKRVVKNSGAPGIDGMKVDELEGYLKKNWERIKEELLEGTYKPAPVRRVQIEKDGGGYRMLGIPTALDRLIQQGLLQVLNPIFNPLFSESSFGFRPGKSAHQAIEKARQYIQEGYSWVVDIDLEKFFDKVNHDMLMARVARNVKDKRVLKLIRAYLTSGVLTEGVLVRTEVGTPQGGPLSPLLANILLDDLDKELERRGHKFVRYADDANIYTKSQRAAERVMGSITGFVEKKLKLKVNKDKSAADRPQKRKFLGISFYRNKEPLIRFHPRTIERFKDSVKRLTSRTWAISIEDRIKKLNEYLIGWLNYYKIIECPSILAKLDTWIRRRLRMCLLRQWRKPSAIRRNLLALGMPKEKVHLFSASRRGAWFLSKCTWINFTITPAFLKQLGLISLKQRYQMSR